MPSNSDSPNNNDGPIRLGGGFNYLLTTFESFSYIKGYTMCGYDEVLTKEGGTLCVAHGSFNSFLLNPFDLSLTSCGTEQLSTDD